MPVGLSASLLFPKGQLIKGEDRALVKAVNHGTAFALRDIKKKMSGPVLKRRTGRLSRSVTADKLVRSVNSVSQSVGSNVVYAPIHEFGGVIKPVNNKFAFVEGGPYISIPTRNNKTAGGDARLSPTQAFQLGGFILSPKFGKPVIIVPGRGVVFVLLKSATIPERPIWIPTLEQSIPVVRNKFFELLRL